MPSSKPFQPTWIPESLRKYFGGVSQLKTYITGVPSDAKAIRRAKDAIAVRHQATLAKVAALPDHVKARIIAEGGDVRKIADKVAELRELLSIMPSTNDILFKDGAAVDAFMIHPGKPAPALLARYPETPPRLLARLDPDTLLMPDGLRMRMRAAEARNELETELDQLVPVALTAEPAHAYTFAGLFDRWAGDRVKDDSARNYKRTANRLAECFGNVDVRKLRRPHARQFKDWLQQNVNGTASQKADIGHAFTLFDALDSHDLPDGNPFVDAKKLRREIGHVTKTKGAFRPAQLRALLKAAEKHRFGDTRQRSDHEAVLWILKILIYHGTRIGETASLTTADVRHDEKDADGNRIAYLHFRREAVKARKDEDKSRKVPLHKDIAAGFELFVKGRTGPVFGDGKLADWVISYFPGFLVKHAAEIGLELVDGVDPKTQQAVRKPVDADGQELTLHRTRSSFQCAAEAADLDKRRIDDIVGHMVKTVDGKYRKQLPVPMLKAAIDKVKPLG